MENKDFDVFFSDNKHPEKDSINTVIDEDNASTKTATSSPFYTTTPFAIMVFVLIGLVFLAYYFISINSNKVTANTLIPAEIQHDDTTIRKLQNDNLAFIEQLKSKDQQLSTFVKKIKDDQKNLLTIKQQLAIRESQLRDLIAIQKNEEKHQSEIDIVNLPKSVNGLSLNSVYSDTAVLERNNKTYFVRVGEKINGVTIQAIDAVNRRVITSGGVIQ